MEEFQSALESAKKKIKVADHMLIMTFPLVKDPKLLLSVVDNTFSATANAMYSLVHYERLYKRIPPFQDTFESKFMSFKSKLVPRHNINKEYVNLVQELKDILDAHKKSPIEFSRGDKFIICSGNYRMKTIGVRELKKYIAQSKLFISDMERLVNKNARVFK